MPRLRGTKDPATREAGSQQAATGPRRQSGAGGEGLRVQSRKPPRESGAAEAQGALEAEPQPTCCRRRPSGAQAEKQQGSGQGTMCTARTQWTCGAPWQQSRPHRAWRQRSQRRRAAAEQANERCPRKEGPPGTCGGETRSSLPDTWSLSQIRATQMETRVATQGAAGTGQELGTRGRERAWSSQGTGIAQEAMAHSGRKRGRPQTSTAVL